MMQFGTGKPSSLTPRRSKMKQSKPRDLTHLIHAIIGITGAIFLASVLTACYQPHTDETTTTYILPQELKDCRTYHITGKDGSWMRVMRCPNSSTATTSKAGKSTLTTVVIDGIKYAPSSTTQPRPHSLKKKSPDNSGLFSFLA